MIDRFRIILINALGAEAFRRLFFFFFGTLCAREKNDYAHVCAHVCMQLPMRCIIGSLEVVQCGVKLVQVT